MANLIPMISILAHRGPDDWGYYVDCRRSLALLHSRLSIVDIQSGRQPLCNEDQSVWVSCNGEIYGYKDWTRRLRSSGHRFRTRTDTEVIVHLYEEYGEGFVQHLRGEFAFALWDGKREILMLVRDRFGIKPLYYAATPESLLFGSEIKAILSHPKVAAAEFDPVFVYSFLNSILLPGYTPFKKIHSVEPGCYLRAERSGFRRVRYWDLEPNPDPASSQMPEAQIVEEFRERFSEAVRLRLQGDVEVGAYLSGGIDSSAVARSMVDLSPRPIKAFTVAFDNPDYDESAFAIRLARRFGIEHHTVTIRPGDLISHFPRSLWHSETPVPNSHGTAKYLLSRLAGTHVKVVLTGEGADELLGGYGQFRHLALLEARHKDPGDRYLAAELNRFLARSELQSGVTHARDLPEYERVVGLFGCYPYAALRSLYCYRKVRLLLDGGFRRRMSHVEPLSQLAASLDLGKLSRLSPLPATQYFTFKTDLPGYILNFLSDREEMAHSVEGRLPFLDHQLVEFVCRLPWRLKLGRDEEKYILRRAMADVVPGASSRPKKVFLAPAESLGLGERNRLADRYLSTEIVREVGIFNPSVLWLCRHWIRWLDPGSSQYSLLAGALTAALSLHILYDLFCKNFSKYSQEFSGAKLDYSLERGTVYRAESIQ